MRKSLIGMLLAGLAIAGPAAAQDSAGGGADSRIDTAIFAGGCFWCMQEAFEKVNGVVSVTAGYTGGTVSRPTYEQVSAGGTGHAESIEVKYDPRNVTYAVLLDTFWHNVDPLTANQQFCDVGHQYRSVIFYRDEDQHSAAEASKKALEDSKRFSQPIVTEISPAGPFYPAEEYHQDYYKKNPARYHFYKWNCGRAQRLEELWGKPKHS